MKKQVLGAARSLEVESHSIIQEPCGAKNVRLIGITNHPATGYHPSLLQMAKYGHIYPFDKLVTHRYPLEKAADALEMSMSDDCLKVAIAAWD